MNTWGKGFLAGVVATLVLVAIGAGTTRFEAFVRVTSGDRFLLDARLDEPALGRVLNIPVATLGEASFAKRSWVIGTTYEFHLQLRPEVAPGPGRAIRDLEVSIRLPGRPAFTNATRYAGGAAVWETLPADALRLRTRAVHWLRILVILIIVAGAIVISRRS